MKGWILVLAIAVFVTVAAILFDDAEPREVGIPRSTAMEEPDPTDVAAPRVEATANSASSSRADAPTDEDATETGALTGRVVNEDDAPVAGAIVRVYETFPNSFGFSFGFSPDEIAPLGETTTGVDGRFRIADLSPSIRYVLLALTETHAPSPKERFPVWSGRDSDCGTIVLRPGRAVSGSVADEDGRPIEAAEVTVAYRHGRRKSATGAGGRFEFAGLSDGRVTLRATKKGYVEIERSIHQVTGDATTPPAHDEVTLVLPRAATITGFVVDAHGSALAGVDVEGQRIDPSDNPGRFDRMRIRTTSNEVGAFELPGLDRAGTYRVRAYLHDHEEAIVDDARPGADPLRLALVPLPAILLRVVDETTGEPVAPRRIDVLVDGKAVRQFWAPRPRSSGAFGAPYGAAGTYHVAVEAVGFRRAESVPIATDGQSSYGPVTIALARSEFDGYVHGVVISAADERPIADAEVRCVLSHVTGPERVCVSFGVATRRPQRWGTEATTRTDAEGRFRLPTSGLRMVLAEVEKRGFARADVPPDALGGTTAESPFVLRLGPAGAVSGIVTGLNGDAARDVPVVVHGGAAAVHTVRTDGSGRYRADSLAPGRYRIAIGNIYEQASTSMPAEFAGVALDATREVEREVTIEAGAEARCDVDLRRLGGTIRGRVLVDGEPRRSHRVALLPEALLHFGFSSTTRVAWTGDDGDFAFWAIPPGPYVVAVTPSHHWHPLATRSVALAVGHVEAVTFDVRTGRVDGIVRHGTTGHPLATSISVTPTESDPSEPFANTRTNAAGSFSLPGLPPGRMLLTFRVDDHGSYFRAVDVSPGDVAQVDLLIDPPGRLEIDLRNCPATTYLRYDLSLGAWKAHSGFIVPANGLVVTLPTVAPGTYEFFLESLSIDGSGADSSTALGTIDVHVESGETTRATLTVSGG